MKIDIVKLRIEMARNCLNQKSLAEKIGRDPATISTYFKKGAVPTSEIGKIAKALGVSVEAILADENPATDTGGV